MKREPKFPTKGKFLLIKVFRGRKVTVDGVLYIIEHIVEVIREPGKIKWLLRAKFNPKVTLRLTESEIEHHWQEPNLIRLFT